NIYKSLHVENLNRLIYENIQSPYLFKIKDIIDIYENYLKITYKNNNNSYSMPLFSSFHELLSDKRISINKTGNKFGFRNIRDIIRHMLVNNKNISLRHEKLLTCLGNVFSKDQKIYSDKSYKKLEVDLMYDL